MTLPFFLLHDLDPVSIVRDMDHAIMVDPCVVRSVAVLFWRVDDRERNDRLSGVVVGLEPSLLHSDVKSCLLPLFLTRASFTPADDIPARLCSCSLVGIILVVRRVYLVGWVSLAMWDVPVPASFHGLKSYKQR